MFGTDPMCYQRMATLDRAAIGHCYQNPVIDAGNRLSAGVFDQPDPAFGKRLLQHQRGVGVLVRQYPVPAGHHRHRDTEFGVGIDEFGAGDTRADDDEVVGQ